MDYQWLAPVSIADWVGEVVLYDQRSGETHLFSGISKDILTFCLSWQRFNATSLTDGARDYFEDRQQTEAFVLSILESLIQKNLIAVNE